MAKQVFTTDEIPHLWAHQTQDSARNQQGNLFFRNGIIFSYGEHFPIAKHAVSPRGNRKAILLTTRKSSVTTTRHMHDVWRAIPKNATVLHVKDVLDTEQSHVGTFERQISEARLEVFGPTGRFRKSKWDELANLTEQANKFAEWYGTRKRWKMPESTDDIKAAIAKAEAATERQHAKNLKAHAAYLAERLRDAEKCMAEWLAGEHGNVSYLLRDLPVRLRVKGDQVESTMGVNFPVDHAIKGIRFIRAVVASGKPYQRNGHTIHLGHYTIDSIDTEGTVTAGCHVVPLSEVERIATLLEVK